jgi:hypothetical protein
VHRAELRLGTDHPPFLLLVPFWTPYLKVYVTSVTVTMIEGVSGRVGFDPAAMYNNSMFASVLDQYSWK